MPEFERTDEEVKCRLMSEQDVAAATGHCVSVRRLQQLRQRGGGPRFLKIGRRVLYDWGDVEEWLESLKQESTSSATAS